MTTISPCAGFTSQRLRPWCIRVWLIAARQIRPLSKLFTLVASTALLMAAGCSDSRLARQERDFHWADAEWGSGTGAKGFPTFQQDRFEESPPGLGSPDFSGEVAVQTLVAHAMDRHPRVAAAHREWTSAVTAIGASRKWPDPMLESMTVIQSRANLMQDGFLLQQQLPNPWELNAMEDEAAAMALTRRLAFYDTVLQVRRDIESAYAAVQALDARLAVMQELQALLESLELRIEANVEARQTDLLRAQTERDEIASEIESERLMRPALLAMLATASGTGQLGDITVTPLASAPEDPPGDRADLLVFAARHPMVAMGQGMALVQEHRLKAAKAMRIPEVAVGVGYQIGQDGMSDAMSLRVGVSIPWQTGSLDAKEGSIRQLAEAELRKSDDVLLMLASEMDMELFRLADARRMHALYQDRLLPRARQTMELVIAEFTTGRASLTDVLDAERAVLAGELVQVRARLDARVALARLGYLKGQ